ncbi:let-413, partial [Symbiodinium natans]
MGIDLYEILLPLARTTWLGLHMKKWFLKAGVYLHDFGAMVEIMVSYFKKIGISDEDVAQLAQRKQCFLGVTQCFPLKHSCISTPANLHDLVSLLLSSMSVVPFFRTPGVFQGKYYVDGGFSAMYSVPEGQRWDEVIKVTCFPWWTTLLPPAMGVADVQPSRFMPTE